MQIERDPQREGRRFRWRRRLFIRAALGTAASVSGGGWLLSAFGERHFPRVYRCTIPIPDLPEALEGFTICQMSDLHRSAMVDEAVIRRGTALANGLRPDLIVLTGDFVTDRVSYAESCARALAPLRAPHGVFAVLGNHDHWSHGADAITAELGHAGIEVLRNRSVPIHTRGTDWWLCGVDDMLAHMADLDAALKRVPRGAFRTLLCHEPNLADCAARCGVPLQLSGHTHGGQVRIPGLPVHYPRGGQRYPIGLERVKDSRSLVYTNVGLGVISVPIRINCPPEVSYLTLRRAS